jgi:hypothetical protein
MLLFPHPVSAQMTIIVVPGVEKTPASSLALHVLRTRLKVEPYRGTNFSKQKWRGITE